MVIFTPVLGRSFLAIFYVLFMGIKCGPLLADLFLHSFEADFIIDLIRNKEYRLARFFNLSFRHTDDVLSLNNPNFWDLIHRI